MANRVQPNDVKDIMTTSQTDTQIDNWIDIANAIVNRYAAQCSTVTAAQLVKIEQLMAAHLIASTVERDKSVTQRSFGDSSETYAFTTGEGLKMSPYGIQILMLDPCGIIGNMTKPKALGRVL